MKDETKDVELGLGPFMIEQDSADMWVVRHSLTGEAASGQMINRKSAARKARDLNGAQRWTEGEPLPEILAELDQANAEADAAIDEADKEEAAERSPSAQRHDWLEAAATWSKGWLADHGTEVPAKVRVSMGTMYASKVAIGQCWSDEASEDGHREVFISPTIADSATIVSTLVHELIHAALPFGTKHGPVFKQAAIAAGLEGKMTATKAGNELALAIDGFIATQGPYPAARLNPALSGVKRQGTRLLKCECSVCGYTVRTTAKWINAAGAPLCPQDAELDEGEGTVPHGRMVVEEVEEGE